MTSFLIVGITAFLAAGLTMYSGFGLGTLMLPVFALFFPAEVAVVATAMVHGANNVFKVSLLGRHADRESGVEVWAAGDCRGGSGRPGPGLGCPVRFQHYCGGQR